MTAPRFVPLYLAFASGYLLSYPVVADLSKAWLGADTAGGLRIAFILAASAQALGYAWFVFGWRRYATRTAVAGLAA